MNFLTGEKMTMLNDVNDVKPRRHNYIMRLITVSIALLCLFGACSNTKYLQEGQTLYTGGKVKIKSEDKIPDKKDLKKDLEKILRPKPNKKFLGIFRLKLWLYNIAGENPKKGIKAWLKNKVGEPPVLYDPAIPSDNDDLIENYLFNKGYFQSKTRFKPEERNRKIEIEYTTSLNRPYVFRDIKYPVPVDELSKEINKLRDSSMLKRGKPYDLELLREERERINNKLKDKGYFFFNADFLIFKADTMAGKREVNISLELKPDIPSQGTTIYRINNIYIFPNYSLGEDTALYKPDTIKHNGVSYIKKDTLFKPEVITRSVFIKKGNIYTRTAHNLTLSRLISLGVFKFVNIRFREQPDSAGTGWLDGYIYLTPMKKKSVRAELQMVSKSNNYAGPNLTTSFRNRNFLKGAELFVLNLNGGFETQISGNQSGISSYTAGIETSLYIPEFLTPFKSKTPSFDVPKSKFDLGYNRINRINFFTFNSFNGSFGYAWKEDDTKEHVLNPIYVNFVNLSNTTLRFDSILGDNPLLRKSFDEQFILGANYTYTFNEQIREDKIDRFYFRTTADISGNTMYLAQLLIKGRKPTADQPFILLGEPFSQYSRLELELRHYHNLNPKDRLVSRIIAGAGFPYGNSATLPYIKQFFVGGVNSIRAFRARSVGPGNYHIDENLKNGFFLDQGGDIKIEANVEYRFNIVGMVNGALFADAGNIWLIRNNPVIPGGIFSFGRFLNEMAVGSGVGIRFDANFFVLRLDLAFPLRKPFLPENERWVTDRIDFGDKLWRRENLILNVAIGYPF